MKTKIDKFRVKQIHIILWFTVVADDVLLCLVFTAITSIE